MFFMVISKYKHYLVIAISILLGFGLSILSTFNLEFILIFYSLISLVILMFSGVPMKNSSISYRYLFAFFCVSNLVAWLSTLVQWKV